MPSSLSQASNARIIRVEFTGGYSFESAHMNNVYENQHDTFNTQTQEKSANLLNESDEEPHIRNSNETL